MRINPNLFRGYASVPLYLITSYLYYQRETSAIPDATYDALCQHLLTHWDRISHPHKNLVVKESLNAGTGYDIDWKSAPKRIIASAESFAQGRHNL